MDLFSVEDKHIVITGASSGFGHHFAGLLAENGARVSLGARRESKLQQRVTEIKAAGGSAMACRLDVCSSESIDDFLSAAENSFGPIDVLINNAGFGSAPDERMLSEDGHEFRFQVNYLAGFMLTRMLMPRLLSSTPSRIVNVSSLAANPIDFDDVMIENNFSGGRAYGQSKHSQVMMTFDLAEELEGTGVMVNALHPATYMDTRMVRRLGQTPMATVDEGATAVMQLVTSTEIEGGQFFNGLRPSRANAQAYDLEARAKLKELTEDLTGLR